MEQKQETIPEYEKANWEEFDRREAEYGDYLRLEPDKPYMIMVKKATLVEDQKYKDRNGNPKMKVILELATVNDNVTDKVFETGSFQIMKEIRKADKEGKLQRSVFLLKKKQEGDKTKYIFEKVSEKGGATPSSGPEAFMDKGDSL